MDQTGFGCWLECSGFGGDGMDTKGSCQLIFVATQYEPWLGYGYVLDSTGDSKAKGMLFFIFYFLFFVASKQKISSIILEFGEKWNYEN